MLMMQYVYNEIKDIIKNAYPDDYKDYLSFFVKFVYNEREREPYGKYNFHKRLIICTNLSRTPSDILLSLLQEVAKHIDVKRRKETHDDLIYLSIFKKLIEAAVRTNRITMINLYKSKNHKMKNKLQESFGSFKNWKINVIPGFDHIYILAFESFMIKNLLKANNYIYDPDQRAWTKYIERADFEEEQYFLESCKHKALFTIIHDSTFFIRPCYELKIETYSIEDAPLWKAFNYTFDNKIKKWKKSIYADELYIELEMISDLPKQKVLISQIK